MTRPMASQMRKRIQVMMGKPAMSRKQKITLSAGMMGPKETRKPRRRRLGQARHHTLARFTRLWR
jgi:hypothetical protein